MALLVFTTHLPQGKNNADAALNAYKTTVYLNTPLCNRDASPSETGA